MKNILRLLSLGALAIGIITPNIYAQSATKAEPGSIEFAKQAALTIDQHVAALFKKKNLSIPENVDDPQFLRRTLLVIAGRIPTLQESTLFLDITDSEKRTALIDYALNSNDYKSSMTNWLFDLLRAQETINRGNGQPYIEWMRDAIDTNKSWKDITHELITAEGSIWKNGAVGYYIRDKGMPLDNTANSMRLFMGTHMECAQCHDHPNDDWERKDFFHLAAFSHHQPEMNSQIFNQYYRTINQNDTYSANEINFLRNLSYDVFSATLKGSGSGRIKLPQDYQYRDGEPGETIGGKTPFSKSIRTSPRRDTEDSREQLSEWMTSAENPRFAATIANRLWQRIFGSGLYEPIDVYIDPSKTMAPALTSYITQLIQDLNYDMKEFQRVLLLTRIYHFKSALEVHATSDIENLKGRQLQRMSAEQIWDSLITLTSGDPNSLPRRGTARPIHYSGRTLFSGEKDMNQLAQEMLNISTEAEMKEYTTELLNEYKKAPKANRKRKASTMMSKSNPAATAGPLTGLVRASEISTPAPEGHFLREFGQSDRLLLEGSSKEANVNQVLSILNGHVEQLIVSNASADLHTSTANGVSAEDKVNILFLSILGRPPSQEEAALFKEEIETSGALGVKNVMSALLCSREFLFIQ